MSASNVSFIQIDYNTGVSIPNFSSRFYKSLAKRNTAGLSLLVFHHYEGDKFLNYK